MESKFRIRVCSDVDLEEMVADICYENFTLATITQENGQEKMEIEIYPPSEEGSSYKFLLEDFLNILQIAKRKLIEMKKISDD